RDLIVTGVQTCALPILLQQVARVMPAAADVQRRAGRERAVGSAAIELMAVGAEPRVVAATLLAHELQQLRRQLAVGIGPDSEWRSEERRVGKEGGGRGW